MDGTTLVNLEMVRGRNRELMGCVDVLLGQGNSEIPHALALQPALF